MYQVKEIKPIHANLAWERSKYASLFCSPYLLSSLGYNSRFYGGFKNNELLVVWPLIETENGLNTIPMFSYYFGPYWVEEDLYSKPDKMFKNNMEVLNCIMPIIESVAPKITFSLVPEFPDLRPFQWWNYHQLNKPRFEIDLRYSARLNFLNQLSENELFLKFRADDKRKKIRKSLRDKLLMTRWGVSYEVDEYIELYSNTLKRTGGELASAEKNILTRMIKLVNNGIQNSIQFKMIELLDASNNSIQGFQLILVGKRSIYAIAQSTSYSSMRNNGNLLLTFEALNYANSNKCIFDFNGANSPNRADDKHAFGAEITTYFDLKFC